MFFDKLEQTTEICKTQHFSILIGFYFSDEIHIVNQIVIAIFFVKILLRRLLFLDFLLALLLVLLLLFTFPVYEFFTIILLRGVVPRGIILSIYVFLAIFISTN